MFFSHFSAFDFQLSKHRKSPIFQAFFTLLPMCFSQQDYALHMARYVQIDVSFREPILTNVDCSKISPFVCGNISTNSVAKKYCYISLSISQSEPRPSTEKVQLFYSFLLYYSNSNIKVKLSEKLSSSPPCLFFVQRTGQQLCFAPINDPTPMHSALVS